MGINFTDVLDLIWDLIKNNQQNLQTEPCWVRVPVLSWWMKYLVSDGPWLQDYWTVVERFGWKQYWMPDGDWWDCLYFDLENISSHLSRKYHCCYKKLRFWIAYSKNGWHSKLSLRILQFLIFYTNSCRNRVKGWGTGIQELKSLRNLGLIIPPELV